jgi:hypothetical protein
MLSLVRAVVSAAHWCSVGKSTDDDLSWLLPALNPSPH